MRTLSLLAGAALALGLSLGTPAQAHGSDARIWVSFGDVAFSAGHPYHRHHHHPLKVTRGRHGPRYYYDPAPAYTYYPARPPYAYPVHHSYYRYPPPPPRPGYSRHRPGYYR